MRPETSDQFRPLRMSRFKSLPAAIDNREGRSSHDNQNNEDTARYRFNYVRPRAASGVNATADDLRATVMEKREIPRHKCFLRAFVYFEGRGTAVDCVVRDISDIGARLQFEKPLVLAELLDLHIPIKGQSFHAEKRWYNGGEMGVAFHSTKNTNADDTGVDRRVERLKSEIDVLKKAIKHLQKKDD
jgi:hypothetical protein